MKRNDLFYLYLKEVNDLDEEPKEKKKSKTESWILFFILLTLAIITAWNVALEVAMKLRFK